ncbi:hypothetical protein AVEN_68032-1 [Araneus ventricosus]|uniref:Uncharacterized protein n=1 Tax=Araneus ventricosus TaxID=182803 RepID=A0A4Y2M854_ARAVE|nr:hypothetical protein AVEN_68032-1 [Araneus ventricosus]
MFWREPLQCSKISHTSSADARYCGRKRENPYDIESDSGPMASPTTEPNKGWQLPALGFPASALAMMLAGTYALGVTPGTVTTLNAKPKE